jgi:RNA polymerase sigma-70 factor (ECF subfamily)
MTIADDLSLVIGQRAEKVDRPVVTVSSETWLADAACRGDRSACEQLYRQYAPMVHSILLVRVPAHEVDDLVQDVFLHAIEKLKGLRDAGAFGAWLAMITRNKAYDFHRQKRPHTDPFRVLMIIKTLPEAYRETLILRLFANFFPDHGVIYIVKRRRSETRASQRISRTFCCVDASIY